MSDLFGGSRRSAPVEVLSQAGGSVQITGTPCYVTIRASGAATIKFAPTAAVPAGFAWPLADGETVDYVVSAANSFLHVPSGTVFWHRS